jgi:hypothetical protein
MPTNIGYAASDATAPLAPKRLSRLIKEVL